MLTIGNISIPCPVMLAPMAGITDAAFREMCARAGAGMLYTEMVSAMALSINPARETHLRTVLSDTAPTALQLFGSDAALMGEMCARHGGDFAAVDLNMGCPAQKIVKGNQGSALLLDLPRAERILRSCVAQSPVPVTVKYRMGWDDDHIVTREFAQMAQACGVAAITLHARTREQFYAGRAAWDQIALVKESVTVPVIGNGDIFTPEDALAMLRQTGCDGVMAGRGAMGNPFLFTNIARALQGLPPLEVTLQMRADALHTQGHLLFGVKDERRTALEMRKHAAWYIKGLRSSAQLKSKAFLMETMADLDDFVTLLRTFNPEGGH